MSDTPIPHEGIELDTIDFSSYKRINTFKQNAETAPDKIDFKIFIRNMIRRLLENDSFLSFSAQIAGVNRILNTKYSSAADIADVILKDVALTSKILKLVNSSFYGQFSHKGIETISEAMIILGTEEIKLAAASLKIYEMMQDIAQVTVLKDKTLKALQRSLMARQIASEAGIQGAEAIQVSAMLYDFGEYLVVLFFPEVYIRIELLAEEKNLNKEQASRSVIGISYSSLGRYIASKWNLPESMTNTMKPVSDFSILKQRLSRDEMQRYICAFTYEICNIGYPLAGPDMGKNLIRITDMYRKSLEIEPSNALKLLKTSRDNIQRHAAILGVTPRTGQNPGSKT